MLSSDISRDFRVLHDSELEGKACHICGGKFSPRITYEVGYEAKHDLEIVGIRRGQIYHEGCLLRKISG